MLPVLFEIGGFPIRSFGLMCALGVLLGAQVAARSFERAGMTRDDGVRAVVWGMLFGLAGSKLWWIGEQWARGLSVDLWRDLTSAGGITWYGGLLAGATTAVVFARISGFSVLAVVNALSPAAAFGQALGRVGCFLVGDDYGIPTDRPWGVAFPNGLPPTLEAVHPTQLYEAAWLVALGCWLWRRQSHSPFLLGEYLALAGVGRLMIELLRTNPALLGPLTNAQVVGVACLLGGAAGWTWLWRRQRAAPLSAPA